MKGLIRRRSKSYRQGVLALVLIVSVCAFNLMTSHASEGRDIYIGDLIELDINSDLISKEALTEAFKDFEIVSLENKELGYHLVIRTMTPNSYEVVVDGQRLLIEVKSTLDVFEREDIFEGQRQSVEENSVLPLWIALALSLIVAFFSGGYLLVKQLKRKKKQTLSAYEKFELMVQESQKASDTYLGAITKALKIYLSTMLGVQIVGLTSSEMIEVLRKESLLSDLIEPLNDWLERCDAVKYRGHIDEDEAVKSLLCEDLLKLSVTIKMILDQKESDEQ